MNKLDLAKTTTDPKVLDELSRDEYYRVRSGVASNLNTTPETLDYLSRDEDYDVRSWVAENPNTTPEILDYLSKDKDPTVRWTVAEHPNTTPETLKKMSIVEEDNITKLYIKSNPNCSEELYRYLSAIEILRTLPKVST